MNNKFFEKKDIFSIFDVSISFQMLLMMPDDQSRKLPMITMARPHSRRFKTPMKSQTQLIKPPLVSFPVASTVLVPTLPLGTLLVPGPVAMVRSRLVKSRQAVSKNI